MLIRDKSCSCLILISSSTCSEYSNYAAYLGLNTKKENRIRLFKNQLLHAYYLFAHILKYDEYIVRYGVNMEEKNVLNN